MLVLVLLDEGVRDEASHARRSSTMCDGKGFLATLQQLQQKGGLLLTTSRWTVDVEALLEMSILLAH